MEQDDLTSNSGSSSESNSDDDDKVEETEETEEIIESSSESEEEITDVSQESQQEDAGDEKPQHPTTNNNQTGSSSSSSSSGESGSSSSGSSSESNDEDTERKPQRRNSNKEKDSKPWEENPDVYGIRRSNRQRKETNQHAIQSSESDEESDESTKKSKRRRKRNDSWVPTLTDSDSAESDSSFEVPQRKNRKNQRNATRGKRTQKSQKTRNISASSDDYGRKSKGRAKKTYSGPKRNAASTVSYKENSDEQTDSDDLIEQDENATQQAQLPEEDVETIEKVVRHRKGWPGQTGAQTTIYADDAEEIAKLGDPDPSKDETELHYLIKWKNWSHLHSTWETKDGLIAQRVKGLKKLDNYIKRMEEIDRWKRHSTPEDVEYFEMQQEMNEDIQKQFQKVERIIAHKFTADSSSGYPDYLCKWHGLPYFECTWEDGALTAKYFQKFIDDYLERERSDTIPNRNAKCLRQRPKFASFKTQPDFIGSEELRLRDYQVDGVNWLVHAWCRDTSVILADEMGLGKTIQTISFLNYLFHKYSLYGPFLVVVPLSTMDAWQREFVKWGPAMNIIVYLGDVNSRTTIQEYEWCFKKNRKLKFNVLLTTYEMLLRDKELLGSLNWAALMIDEAHRLKNEDSLLYRMLINFKTNFRTLITGTPLQNSLKELWSLLHFLMPNKFDDWLEFESQYSVSDKEGLQKLHRDLEPFLLRRVKKDVEKSLPAKVEQILRVEMSQVQKQYYKMILTRNVQELCRELKGAFSGLLNIVVELKKCCNHASLIKPMDQETIDPNILQTLIIGSGKMILLDKLLCRLKETGHRVLIFSQMVRMLDIIADYLVMKRFPYQRLDGSIRGELRKRALDHFNAEGSQDFCFLLSTRAGGLGINLATADTVIIFDSDWNPQNDLQAMARAHRIGQKNQVNIYRFVTKNTIEENIIERAKKKMVLDHLIIQRMDTTGRRILSKSNAPSSNPFNKEELSSILKFGAEDLFKEHDQDHDQKLHAMDIDDILQRAEMQETQEDNSVNEDLLSQFKVVNYAAFNEEEIKAAPASSATPIEKLWEEIIPAEERLKVEEEKIEEMKLKPRSRKAVEKMGTTLSNETSSSKRVKSKEFIEDDFSTSSSDEDAKETTAGAKKASRKQKPLKKEGVKGFTDAEIRRFIKSYKKFARPVTRLDAISEDAELTDKSTSELRELSELLKSSCEQTVKEYEEKLLQDEQFDGKKKGASLKISGVTVNAHSVMKAERDLEPLATCLPEDEKQLKGFRLTIPTRSVHWGLPWGNIEDSMLLVGMLMYGIGNWDTIKNDQTLKLTNKILPTGKGKPQEKQLMSRGEYLLRLLRESQTDNPKQKKIKLKIKTSSIKSESKASSDHKKQDVSDEKPATVTLEEKPKKEKKKKSEKSEKKKKNEKSSSASNKTKDKGGSEENEITVKEIGELDDATFKSCKEKMRAEKKSLQQLHQPDQESSEQAQLQATKKCLLKIGDHIEKTLTTEFQHDQPLAENWRSKLWTFVSKFTELGASKLFKLYRTACRKRDSHKKEIQKMKANHTSTLQEVGKTVISTDRVELEEARKKALGLDAKSAPKKIPKIKHKNENKIKTKESWDPRRDYKHFGSKGTSSTDQLKNNRNPSPMTGGSDKTQYNNNDNKTESKNNEGGGGKALTYREWKEQQQKRNEEKAPSKHERPFKERKYADYDEKPAQHNKYYEAPRRPKYARDFAPMHENSPRTSQSPSYYGGYDRNERGYQQQQSYPRKRTISNNSDSTNSSDVKKFKEYEQVSPEPGEIT